MDSFFDEFSALIKLGAAVPTTVAERAFFKKSPRFMSVWFDLQGKFRSTYLVSVYENGGNAYENPISGLNGLQNLIFRNSLGDCPVHFLKNALKLAGSEKPSSKASSDKFISEKYMRRLAATMILL